VGAESGEATGAGAVGAALLLIAVIGLLAGGAWRAGGIGRDMPRAEVAMLTLLGVTLVWLLCWYLKDGLGSWFAVTVSPQLRAYGRLIPFLVLVGLISAGLLVGRTANRLGHARSGPALWAVSLVVVVLAAMEAARLGRPAAEAVLAERDAVGTYVKDLQASVGDTCPIAQLPLVPWPEYVPPGTMESDEHAKFSMVDEGGASSFSAVKFADQSAWQASYYFVDPVTSSRLASLLGFCGVSVNLAGYSGQPETMAALVSLLGEPEATASDRLAGFSLVKFGRIGRRRSGCR
jgi:phosphoglycerol transferase